MAKEIYEQPELVRRTIANYVDFQTGKIVLPVPSFSFKKVKRLTICGCGTDYYASLVSRYWFERIARLPVAAHFASEFRYGEAPLDPGDLTIVVSETGETADTVASLHHAKAQGQYTLSIVNVATCSIARDSDVVAPTFAGSGIGSASARAFTCQLAVLLSLAIAAGRDRGHLSEAEERRLVDMLVTVPGLMSEALRTGASIEGVVREIAKATSVLYLGRGTSYPLALEGASNLKEISNIHAEGYPAGELKHGPIALIDEMMPVIVIAPYDAVLEKTIANMQEVAARGGRILLISDTRGIKACAMSAMGTVIVPDCDPLIAPFIYAVPIQLLAYHTAVVMRKKVDQSTFSAL